MFRTVVAFALVASAAAGLTLQVIPDLRVNGTTHYGDPKAGCESDEVRAQKKKKKPTA